MHDVSGFEVDKSLNKSRILPFFDGFAIVECFFDVFQMDIRFSRVADDEHRHVDGRLESSGST